MKKIIYIILLFMLTGCPFTFDPARGLLNIWNDSHEAVYVHFNCGNIDSLPLNPKLELFYWSSNDNMEDAYGNPFKSGFVSPEYRINAYTFGSLRIWGTPNHPRLPCEENELTLFFITEKTILNYDWGEIFENQMFVKRITLTEKELKNNDWNYTYSP